VTIKRPAFTASAGLMWMWRPDVVMSDAADLVEVHTLRVEKPSDSHSGTACWLVSSTALNCIAAYPPPPRPHVRRPCQLRSVGDEACSGDMTSSNWLIRMQLGGSDDRSVLDSDEYPTAGRAHPKFAAHAHGVRGSAVCIVRGNDLLRSRPASNADRPRSGSELSLNPTDYGQCCMTSHLL
jgi:hypothetical protein